MPATSASVERLFSVAGQVVTAKRASLDPETVTLLVFLHEAIPGVSGGHFGGVLGSFQTKTDKNLQSQKPEKI